MPDQMVEEKMEMENAYISCACNRLPHAADWSRSNLLCFASNYAIVIYDPNAEVYGKIQATLHKHTDRVNVVKWIKPKFPQEEKEFLSASSDGTVIIWQKSNGFKQSYEPIISFNNKDPVNLCDAVYFDKNESNLLICSGTTSGDLRLWLRINNQISNEPKQILSFSRKLPTEFRLVSLNDHTYVCPKVILLIAMEDSSIQIFSSKTAFNDSLDFIKVQTLVGHEDWVTSIDYMFYKGDIFIASASQDNFIRLWKIMPTTNKMVESNELKTKKQSFYINEEEFEVILESILYGHEAWVYEVHWHPPILVENQYLQPLKLLSCSLDKTAIIWEECGNDGVWAEKIRVGEVGGNSLGFYGCKFGPSGHNFLTYSFHGSLHVWNFNEVLNVWKPIPVPSGHFGAVVDLCWDSKGRFLITTSTDQTTRVHAPWNIRRNEVSWREIGRPQIHGYDMSCLSIISPNIFASGAEEKVVRIFTAPLVFIKYLQTITDDLNDFNLQTMAEGASVPALGLTNKAILDNVPQSNDDNFAEYDKDLDYNKPPVEEDLIRKTLWPELQKLYGHGYEIFSMSTRHDGSMLATACKSTSAEHAAIIIWNTKVWSQSQKLQTHQLTVTQLAFSPNDKYLLSVSRDRRWAIHVVNEILNEYELLIISPKKDSLHTRIIWCCAWTPDSNYFATGSRDGNVGIWDTNFNSETAIIPKTKLFLKDVSITAVGFGGDKNTDESISYIIAIGYDSGNIDIRRIIQNNNGLKWVQLTFLNTSQAHHLTVRRLSFRPLKESEKLMSENSIQLASCGSDGLVKIFNLK